MKYQSLLIVTAIATTFGLEVANKPVVVEQQPITKSEAKLYTASLRIETLCPSSTANALASLVSQDNVEGVTVAVHCIDCQMGVYAPDEEGKEHCSYCGKFRNKE